MNLLIVSTASALLIFNSFSPPVSKQMYVSSVSSYDSISTTFSEIEQASRISSSSIEGKVVKAEKKFAKDRVYWEVEVVTASGSYVELHISTDENRIFAITADEGPFDYELNAGHGLLNFSDARSKAEIASGSKVLKWKLVEAKSGMQYHFWFFTKGGAAQFKLDAVSGERITKKSVRKKK